MIKNLTAKYGDRKVVVEIINHSPHLYLSDVAYMLKLGDYMRLAATLEPGEYELAYPPPGTRPRIVVGWDWICGNIHMATEETRCQFVEWSRRLMEGFSEHAEMNIASIVKTRVAQELKKIKEVKCKEYTHRQERRIINAYKRTEEYALGISARTLREHRKMIIRGEHGHVPPLINMGALCESMPKCKRLGITRNNLFEILRMHKIVQEKGTELSHAWRYNKHFYKVAEYLPNGDSVTVLHATKEGAELIEQIVENMPDDILASKFISVRKTIKATKTP